HYVHSISPSVFTTIPLSTQNSKISWRSSFIVLTFLALLFQMGVSRIRSTTSRLATMVLLGNLAVLLVQGILEWKLQ
ncbi:MAG: hypothetical protein JSV87_03030, partial [Candidatus Bathyarchaeota archaeon]